MTVTAALKKNYEFVRVYKKGRFFVGKYISLYVLPNSSGRLRLGITASKKVGKSVKRNRIKRLIKENYRLYEDFIRLGFDLVFVARESDTLPDFLDIKKEMKFLMKRLGVLNTEKWELRKNS